MKLPFPMSQLSNRDTLLAGNRRIYVALAGLLLVVVIAGISLWTGSAGNQPAKSTLFAESASAAETVDLAPVGGDLWSSIWPIVAMILVLGALYGSLYLLRTFTNREKALGRTLPVVSLQTSVRLGSNQTLHVVQFSGRQLLLGASQAGLVVLDRAPAPESASDEAQFDGYLRDVMVEEAQQ